MKALLLLLLLPLAACEKELDDATQVRAVVDQVAAAAQKHDINAMMEHVTSDYTARPGSRDEQAVRPLLLLALRKYGRFTVKYPVPGIEVAQNGATADVSVPFLVVREGQAFPEMSELADDPKAWADEVAETVGDPYQLDLDLQKTGDGWKITRSEIAGFKSVHDL